MKEESKEMKPTLTELRNTITNDRLSELIEDMDCDDEKAVIAQELLMLRERQGHDKFAAISAYLFEVICLAREIEMSKEDFFSKLDEIWDAHVEEFPANRAIPN